MMPPSEGRTSGSKPLIWILYVCVWGGGVGGGCNPYELLKVTLCQKLLNNTFQWSHEYLVTQLSKTNDAKTSVPWGPAVIDKDDL